MIPRTHIEFNDDHTKAWLVMPADPISTAFMIRNEWFPCSSDGVPDWWAALDRPCETCNGRKAVEAEFWDLTDPNNHLGWVDCPDCHGTGRHTFAIDIKCPTYGDTHIGSVRAGTGRCEHGGCTGGILTFRVSVVPGMVLPILTVGVEGYPTDPPEQFVWITKKGVLRVVNCVEKSDTHCGQAPSAATKGMYAVKLAVHQ
jgi:hypothetical protein